MKKKKKVANRIKLFLIIGMIVVLTILLFKPSVARYVYNGLKDYYYESKSFYFNSDKLSTNGAIFQLDNWDGVNTFTVTFNMNSFKNNYIASNDDIEYDIEYECSSKATCTISKNSGLISSSTNTDYFVVTIVPNTTLVEGDSITLDVKATSVNPYEKELTGQVRLNVGIPGIAYDISDKANRPYLDFNITNTLDFYQVVTAFGNYSVGDVFDETVYNSLSSENQKKCTSALIRLDFDPNVILVDITSEFYETAYSYTTQTINNKAYVNSVVFGMGPVSSTSIRFYKVNAVNDYTYPYVNPSSIIQFTVL